MKVNIFPIVSSLHEETRINEQTQLLLDELIKCSNHQFNIVEIDDFYDADLSLILIQSGGSEGLFLSNFDKLKEPFYLLTYGHNNSLAASLEILSYIKDNDLKGEILHGNTEYLNTRINELLNKPQRLGVIGKPSDWLIASQVDYEKVKVLHNIELVDVDIDEIVDMYNIEKNYDISYDFCKEELVKSTKLHFKILSKYNLNGLTIRCFSLLEKLNTTACLGLALLNDKGIISTCEGDIPAMISMHILNKITGCPGFQANPSRIDVINKRMVLAHCTLPLSMTKNYKLDTHFESGIGVAVKGEMKEETITIFKLSKDLRNYYVSTGKIIKNLNEPNLCRTQIEISVDENIEYFLNRPYGNHHIIVYGDYKEEITEYMKKF